MWEKVFLLVCICSLPVVVLAEIRLRIVHCNDMHGRFDQTSKDSGKCKDSHAAKNKCYGGFPRMITAVNAEKKRAETDKVPIIFLNAGDSFFGSIWYTFYKWPIVADFMKLLKPDVMSLGNHEFDSGPANLTAYLKNVSIPTVVCNIDVSAEPLMKDAPLNSSLVIEKGNLKIGIVGYLTNQTYASSPGKVIIKKEAECLTAEVKKLKDSGVKIIIGLGHSGYDVDQELAKAVPDLDILVGGHTHSFLYTGEPPDKEVPEGPYPTMVVQDNGRKVAIVQAYAYTKYLGSLDVIFDDNGEVVSASGKPILLDSTVEQNAEALAKVAEWKVGLDNAAKEPIATTRVFLNGSCKSQECNLGNLVTDSYVDYAVKDEKGTSWTSAAIALYSGGGIRASIDSPNGLVTRLDAISVTPYFRPLVVIKLKGEYLLQALEWSISRYDANLPEGRGEFLQVSGLHVVFDVDQSPGSRIVRASARCANCRVPAYYPINPEETYPIIVETYLLEGGDNYSMISQHKTIVKKFDMTDTEVFTDYLKEKKLLYGGVEERIRINSSPAEFKVESILLLLCLFYHFYY